MAGAAEKTNEAVRGEAAISKQGTSNLSRRWM